MEKKLAQIGTILQLGSTNDVSDAIISSEFSQLIKLTETPEQLSKLHTESNHTLNRYCDIVPYKHNYLSTPNVPYYNASYINSYNGAKKFIASQGPIPSSIEHTWEVVWENSVSSIMDLVKCVEGNIKKCTQYWPDKNEKMDFKNLTVTNLDEKSITKSIKASTLNITQKASGKSINVTHYNYLAWPDHNIPTDFESLMYLVEQAAKPGMVLTHCSAGVGRTGTFIAICNCLCDLANKKCTNIFETVLAIKQQRCFSVEMPMQYAFIYKFIKAVVIPKLTKS